MLLKTFKFKNFCIFRHAWFIGAILLLSFNTVPVNKNPLKVNTSTYQLYSAFINFQNAAVTPPNSYAKDYGKGFGNATISTIGSSFKYGWKNEATLSPIDISEEASGNAEGVGRNRLGSAYTSASTSEKLEGTFIHMQGNNNADWQNQPRGKKVFWELEVPNGYLEVTLSFGDKGIYTDSRHTATVEGYSIIAAFAPVPLETRTATMLVKVDDGALTISGTGGYNSKINYIEVHEIVHDEDAADGVLVFDPQNKNLNLIAGKGQGVITSNLSGTGANSIGLIIENDMTSQNNGILDANDWLTLPENPSTGQLNFMVNATGMQTGDTRESTVIATAAGFKPIAFNASLAIVAGCSPLSLLPCNQLMYDMPLNLAFDGSEDGLADANGTATGFTTATPHSALRSTEDQPASYPSVNGYEPEKININNGNLTLTATKGLAALAKNRQVNTLGTALKDLNSPFQVETKLLDLNMPSNGKAQVGLNFGFDEDNYVKLVVLNGNSIQLRKEIKGKSASGFNNADNITIQNLDLTDKNVSLRLVFDTNAKTINAYYAIDQGNYIPLNVSGKSDIILPDALLAGLTDPSNLIGASLAGIFASYNSAPSAFDATFDYFNIAAVEEAKLSALQMEKPFTQVKAYPNPVKDILNITFPQQKELLTTISIYDLQGRMVRSYAPQSVKASTGYRVETQNLSSGVYLLQLRGKKGESAQIKFIKSN